MTGWLDSHCHLTADRYDADRTAVMERAREAGLSAMIAIGSGYGLEGNAPAVALAHEEPDVYAAVGVHPHEASEFEENFLENLRSWLRDERVVALGECGLDHVHSRRTVPSATSSPHSSFFVMCSSQAFK